MHERRFDVFLSYNRADERAVERLARQLRERRLEPWLDRWALTPGGPWQEEIVEGLRASRSCAVVVGPAGLGDWAREELAVAQDLAAKDRAFRIFMVLLPGALELADPGLAFLRTRSWVDLREGISDRDGLEELVSAITRTPRQRHIPVADSDTCPYRGLEVFEEQHAALFFGRENDIALVIEKLKSSRFLAVLGASGSGKSSLLRAGLLSALRRGVIPGSEDWSVRVLTPGARPVTALAAQMTHLFAGTQVHQTLDRLHEDSRTLDLAASVALGDRPEEERVLLVVDQFEEVFTVCADDHERNAFLANLLYASTIPGGRVMVVIGMRADFFPRCAPHADLRALVADQQFIVGPLDASGVRRAIEEPARGVGLELEPGLTETIIADVANRPGGLPLLSHVLLEVWQRRRGDMLTLEAYVASGGVEGALAQRANAVYTGLNPARQAIARRVLLRLVQPGEGAEDTRRRAEMGELVTRPDERDEVEAVVGALADQRLLTTGQDELSGARVIDITHEALIRGWPELRDWINEDREALRAHRHLTEAAAEWDRRGRHDDDLYGGARLAYWRERGVTELNTVERAFIDASQRREGRERSARRRRVELAVGGVVLGLSVVTGVALLGLRNAAEQRDTARSRQLAVEAIASLQTDPGKGFKLAAEAYQLKPTKEAELALREAAATPGSRVEVLPGHDTPFSTAAFSPDGRLVVAAGGDSVVAVWDLANRGQPVLLRGHEREARAAVFTSDGQRIVSGGADGTVRLWDWSRRTTIDTLSGHEREVRSVTSSADSRWAASGSVDGTVRMWDLANGSSSTLLVQYRGTAAVAFAGQANMLVTAGADGAVHIWDWPGGRERASLRVPSGVVSVALSADGERVVIGGVDGALRLWDWSGGGEPTVLRGHASLVLGARFSPDGTRIVSASVDQTVRVWDWASGTEPTVLRGHAGVVPSAVFSPDGKQIVSSGVDGIRLWDWEAVGQPTVLRGHTGSVNMVGFSATGAEAVTAGHDATVRIWDVAGGNRVTVLEGHSGDVRSAAFDADGRRVVSAGSDGTVRVWDRRAVEGPIILDAGGGTITSAAFAPSGRRIVASSMDHVVRVWDASGRGGPIAELRHDGVVFSAAFSPDESRVVTASLDGTVRLWEWAGGGEPTVLRGHTRAAFTAVFSPDGSHVVSASVDGTVRVWDWARAAALATLRGHAGAVQSADFSPDGRKVVSAGGDGTVRVWDWAGGGEPTVLRTHTEAVMSARFSPDGRRVASAGLDGTVRIRECPTCDASLDELVALALPGVSP